MNKNNRKLKNSPNGHYLNSHACNGQCRCGKISEGQMHYFLWNILVFSVFPSGTIKSDRNLLLSANLVCRDLQGSRKASLKLTPKGEKLFIDLHPE
jgi:hypothetical protein